MARILRNVVLLECSDEAALAETLALLPPRMVVWQVSATIVALLPEAYEEALVLLRRAGLTPRVVAA
jgi:hypothetical protein